MTTAPASAVPSIEPILEPSDSRVMVPAGTYYLGDISRLLDATTWDRLHDVCGYDEHDSSGVIAATLEGRHVVVMATAYGDGRYSGVDGHDYRTDTGSLGLLTAALADPDLAAAEHGCRMVAFPTVTQCHLTDDGTLHFGRHVIATDVLEAETQQCTWCSEDLDELGYCPTGCGPDGRADEDEQDD